MSKRAMKYSLFVLLPRYHKLARMVVPLQNIFAFVGVMFTIVRYIMARTYKFINAVLFQSFFGGEKVTLRLPSYIGLYL